MAKLKIYGIARSRTFRVLWMAHELGLEYEHIPTDFSKGETRTPEFLAINPMGAVPAIVDGDFKLWDSTAIDLYLAKTYDNGLYPRDGKREALALQWTLFAMTDLERPQEAILYNRLILPEPERDEALARNALEAIKKPLAVLAGALERSPYLLGDTFTFADFTPAAVVYPLWSNRLALDGFPAVSAWVERCLSRPAALAARRLRE